MKILILFSLIIAGMSAFLDNVTTVLILTPVMILVAVELGLSPTPFVISYALVSNIGGTATLIGDPPNIMIGSAAGLGFADFLVNLGPLILILLVAHCAPILLFFRKRMTVNMERRAHIMEFDEKASLTDKATLLKSLSVLTLVISGFLLHGVTGIEPATVALDGNGTLIGASANVVSSGLSGKSGYTIGFMEFTRYGFIIMVVTLGISTLYVHLRYLI